LTEHCTASVAPNGAVTLLIGTEMAETQANPRQIQLQRIYLKDASLELPNAPQIFTRQWNPQVDVQLTTGTSGLGDAIFQVVLSVTVTAKVGDETAFLVEVHQAGIFQLAGFELEPEIQAVLAGYCPGVIFPFAREAVADLVQRGGFPPILLQPINFEAAFSEFLRSRGMGGPQAAPLAGNGGVLNS
jgi:preprotein translocase subunit SecB